MLASILSHHERLVKHHAFITTGDENDPGVPKEFNILLPMANTDLKRLLYEKQFESHCGDLVQLLIEARNILDALAFLHRSHIIEGAPQTFCHMDLKLDNILVYDLKEKKWPELNEAKWPAGCWKISDFGISSTSERPQPLLRTLSQRSPAASLAFITGNSALISKPREAGPYSAPEVHQGRMVDTPSDVWSFGCILFQILVRGVGGIAKCKKFAFCTFFFYHISHTHIPIAMVDLINWSLTLVCKPQNFRGQCAWVPWTLRHTSVFMFLYTFFKSG